MNDLIFKVPACNLFGLDYKLTKINKKAVKLGLPGITTEVVQVQTIEKMTGVGCSTRFARVYHIRILGDLVRLPGWVFLGTVEHTPAGNILRAIPGETLPMEYRSIEPKCDHCKTDRARKNTFVVRHTESGKLYQVGRQCTQDFLGGVSPERLGLMAELVKEFEDLQDEDGEFKGSRKESIHLEEYLETVAALVLKYGFISRAASRAYSEKSEGAALEPTSSRALTYFSRDKEVRAKLEPLAITPEVREHAAKALAWARGIDEFTSNDYLHNLYVISHKEFVGFKDAGLVAALVGTYTREVAKIEIERKRAQSFAEKHAGSQFVGELKKRSNYVLTLTKIVSLKNEYGEADRALYCFEDSTGNQFIWFSSKHVESVTEDGTGWSRKSLREGETYQVRGTVKAHNLYKGVKQTMLTRCDLTHALEVKANENLAG